MTQKIIIDVTSFNKIPFKGNNIKFSKTKSTHRSNARKKRTRGQRTLLCKEKGGNLESPLFLTLLLLGFGHYTIHTVFI